MPSQQSHTPSSTRELGSSDPPGSGRHCLATGGAADRLAAAPVATRVPHTNPRPPLATRALEAMLHINFADASGGLLLAAASACLK